MTAPVNIKVGQGAFVSASGSGTVAHGIGAQSNVLQMLHIFVQNDGSACPTINAPTSDNGLTWVKKAAISHTELVANGAVSKDVPVRVEVWSAFGAVTNGGSWAFTLSGSTDGICYIYSAWTGEDTTEPYDLNATAIQTKSTNASAACDTTTTSDTSNCVLIATSSRAAGSFADNPTFSSGSQTGGTATNNFSSATPMRHYMSYKATTGGLSSVVAGYSAATSNSNQANHELITVVITADSQGAGPAIANGDLVTQTMSLLAGSASSSVTAPGDTVLQTMSLIPGSAGDTSALDGSKILEFTGHLITDPNRYQNDDYDSIYSIGDRIQSGLFTSGRHFPGTIIVFGSEDQCWDNSYSGNGFLIGDGGANINAGDGFYFNTGANDLDLRGFKLLGDDTTDDGRNSASWVIKPGFAPGQVIDISYASNFNAFVPTQSPSTLDPFTGEKSSEYLITPHAPISYPHYEFQFANTGRLNTDRWCNEMHLKIAHSTLDGGDRRPGHASAAKTVLFALGPGIVFRNDAPSHFIDPQDSWFDGDNYYGSATSHTLTQGQIGETLASTQITTVGKYIQFQFPRKVMMKHLVVQMSNGVEDYDSGGVPTVLGAWHWEVSQTGASFETLAGTWKFNEGSKYALAPGQAPFDTSSLGDQDGYVYWRMVLDAGSAFGGGNSVNQIMFDLTDKAELQPTLSILFTDDADGIVPTADIGQPGSPFTVLFTDNSGDGLSYTLSVIINPLLSITFTDEGDFEPLGDFYPATYVQTLLMVTGR